MERQLSRLVTIGEAVRERWTAKHAARERALPQCREAVRHCANAIRAVHRGEFPQARVLLEMARSALTQVRRTLEGHGDVYHAGFLHDAEKEFAEAAITLALVAGEVLVGCSTNNPEEARRAQEEGADYVGVGAIFPTATKADTRPATLETIGRVKAAVSMPVVAIGGINQENIAQVMAAGADAAAVISAIGGAPDIEAATRDLMARISEAKASASPEASSTSS